MAIKREKERLMSGKDKNNSRTDKSSINKSSINKRMPNNKRTSGKKGSNSNITGSNTNTATGKDKKNSMKGNPINNKKQVLHKKEFNRNTIPLLFCIAVVPLIVKMYNYSAKTSKYLWGDINDTRIDFFLYYKQWAFVAAAVIMAVMLSYKVYKDRYKIKLVPALYPLALYALLAILSTIFSSNIRFSLGGSMDQFESVFVLLGYCIIVFYTFFYIQSENDMEIIIRGLLICTLVMSALGISQYLGEDFFATDKGTRLITGGVYGKGDLNFVMGEGRVYMTLFNPNYVGVYVSMVLPIFLVLLLYSKKLLSSLLYLAASAGLLVCLFGSQSLAGFAGLAAAVFGIVVVMWRYLLKRFYIAVPVFLVLLAALFILNRQTNNFMLNRVMQAFDIKKAEEPALSQIITGDDMVSITYKKSKMNMSLKINDTEGLYYVLTDGDGNEILYDFDAASGEYIIRDERYPFRFMHFAQDNYISFYVNINGKRWVFSNQLGDGTYYYYNDVHRWDKIIVPPAVFTGYESFASNRGYIWSRTLPLINKRILLGEGPDTFLLAFPQQDYVGLYNHGYTNMIITKPHSLYLQIAVNTGLISLIAFLAFYAIYFFTSLRLYIRGRFNSFYAKVGVAIMIGTAAYMVTGLTNDSSITTAPVFWCLMGLGIAANTKAKPLIMEEIAAAKAKKQAKKQGKIQE